MKIRLIAGRWTILTLLAIVMNILGFAGAWLNTAAFVSKTEDERAVLSDSCPAPTADVSKKENKKMTTTVQRSMLPLIDTALPAKTETATFGLG